MGCDVENHCYNHSQLLHWLPNGLTAVLLRLLHEIEGTPLLQGKIGHGVVLGEELGEELAGVLPPGQHQGHILGFDGGMWAANLMKE